MRNLPQGFQFLLFVMSYNAANTFPLACPLLVVVILYALKESGNVSCPLFLHLTTNRSTRDDIRWRASRVDIVRHNTEQIELRLQSSVCYWRCSAAALWWWIPKGRSERCNKEISIINRFDNSQRYSTAHPLGAALHWRMPGDRTRVVVW